MPLAESSVADSGLPAQTCLPSVRRRGSIDYFTNSTLRQGERYWSPPPCPFPASGGGEGRVEHSVSSSLAPSLGLSRRTVRRPPRHRSSRWGGSWTSTPG